MEFLDEMTTVTNTSPFASCLFLSHLVFAGIRQNQIMGPGGLEAPWGTSL